MSKSVIIVASALMLAAMIGTAIIFFVHKESSHENQANTRANDINSSQKAIETLCQPTSYRATCINSISSETGGTNITDFKELVKIGFKVTKKEIITALKNSKTIKATQNDPRTAQALEICHEVVSYAINDLERSIESIGKVNISSPMEVDGLIEDIKVWIGGAMTYQEVCYDAFENTTDISVGIQMRNLFKLSRMMTSNALAMVDEVKTFIKLLDIHDLGFDHTTIPTQRRRLLLTHQKPGLPTTVLPFWITDRQRHILNNPIESITPNLTVALDGTGNYTHINDALNQIPHKNTKPFIIHIKSGTYKQHIKLSKKMTNVIFIGDGQTKTIITASRSFTSGYQTYKTATVAIMGDGFIAKDITFENSAGPQGHQAVAIRVTGDYSIFYNCTFNGYQDTLYAVRSRQFYRDCTITGTIDFIFGNAIAVFQNCSIIIRKPLPNQSCMVTAQGRNDSHSPGITLLHGCSITGTKDYMEVKDKNKGYLGRPWKEYSRTIVMDSYISDAIAPQGWMPWSGDFGLNTLFYGEFNNKGDGADQSRRVKWSGLKKLDSVQVKGFSPEKVFSGSAWIVPTGAPYTP